jgi:hypothetical protein
MNFRTTYRESSSQGKKESSRALTWCACRRSLEIGEAALAVGGRQARVQIQDGAMALSKRRDRGRGARGGEIPERLRVETGRRWRSGGLAVGLSGRRRRASNSKAPSRLFLYGFGCTSRGVFSLGPWRSWTWTCRAAETRYYSKTDCCLLGLGRLELACWARYGRRP